jgi:TPR repeat protein
MALSKEDRMKQYKKAAHGGNVDAMFNYGFGLANGYLGSINKKEAMVWYKKAADLGNVRAMVNYGIGLANGYLGSIN